MTSQNTIPHRQRDCVVNFDNTNQRVSTTISDSNPDKGTQNNYKLKIFVAVSFLLILGLYGYVGYKEVTGEEKVVRNAVTHVESKTSSLPHVGIDGPRTEKLQGDEHLFRTRKEGYRLTGEGRSLSWGPTKTNANTFSEPVPNKLCIRIKHHGEYDIYNKMTLQYKNATSVYNTLAHSRADTIELAPDLVEYVVEKNVFQWRPRQTGRVPSILQTVDSVKAAPGDMFCTQTQHNADIYNSYRDNHLVIIKVS